VYVCPLITRERVVRLLPDFQYRSGGAQKLYQAQKIAGGQGPENFLFVSRCTGVDLLAVLGSPSLRPSAALATGWPRGWTRDTLPCPIKRSHSHDGGLPGTAIQ